MKLSKKLAALLAGTAVMLAGIGANQAQAKPLGDGLANKGENLLLAQDSDQTPDVYQFTLTNNTGKTITVVAAADAEGGESMGTFDLEDGKIEDGATVTLVWDESTNNTGCNWAITVGFEDGSVAEPAIVDFCAANVELTVE